MYCANSHLKAIGSKQKSAVLVPEAERSPNKIGNLSRPNPIECLPGCTVQENKNQISSTLYPQREIFYYQKIFCYLASHILQQTCRDDDRRFFMDKKQPELCAILEDFDEYFGNTTSCEDWPTKYFVKNLEPDQKLLNDLYIYGRDNLAMIHVMIQSPYVTKIKRDVAMSFTNYVANTGGLLGLCVGFSFISILELIFWCWRCCMAFKRVINSPQKKKPNHVIRVKL